MAAGPGPDATDIGSTLIVHMQKTESWKQDCLGLAILLGVALAIGIYLIATSVLISKDGVFYIEQTQKLAHDPLGAARRYPIGYPFLLLVGHKMASLFADGDSAAVWIVSSQAVTLLCRMGALVFLYLLGRMLVGARRSFWGVLILIVLPYAANNGSDVLREWPFVLFLAAGFWLLLRALREGKLWLFGLVGLAAGLGYLIRPMCGQLIVYALLGLAVAGFDPTGPGLPLRGGYKELVGRALPYLFLLMGFATVAVPYWAWTGTAVPHQFRPESSNSVPVITAIGGKSASDTPLSFNARVGESFEATIEASDLEGDALTVSVASVPPGTRPVYRFRSARYAADFWTISELETDALQAYPREVWSYEGIDYYAYAEPGAASGLAPVYRLWSPVLKRHFYTIDASERKAILENAPEARWRSEAVAFHAFPEGHEPPEAVPVYRFRDADERYFWTVEDAKAAMARLPGEHVRADGIAWYAHVAGSPPVNSVLDEGVFRWRPESHQQGEHLLYIIVSDGELESCQLVRIVVDGESALAGRPPTEAAPRRHLDTAADLTGVPPTNDDRSGGSVLVLLVAVGKTLGSISENLMIFFFVPLCVGLYYRLRCEAGLQERVLTSTVVGVNLALMLGRYLWIEPGSARRYSVGLIALVACYIPAGLALMSRWSRMALDRLVGDRGQADLGEKVWFGVLLAVGVAICTPKLLTPLCADKTGYREAARWLQNHTGAEDVVAVPDGRISFYAERRGRFYQEHADPRKADYVVLIASDASSRHVPEGWSQRHSCWVNKRCREKLVIYRIP